MFFYGSSYYLPHHEEKDWPRDFARMKEYGHNCIRTGELLASWDLYEKEPRKPNFYWLDKAFELAGKNGLKILLGTGACNPPGWLAQENPDLPIQDRDGNNYPPGAMWGWACLNHPAYLEETDRYLKQLLERYGQQSALIGWQIHNEPGYPFIPQEDKSHPDWYDYNPWTIKAYRQWLEEKYTKIDHLNGAWLWDPSNIQYNHFEEIDAPRRSATEWAVPVAWLDWRTFTYDNWNRLIYRQHQLIKAATPELPSMTNMMGNGVDVTGRLGVDVWKLPKAVDVMGYDLYPGIREQPGAQVINRKNAFINYTSWFLDMAWSTAKHHQKPLWLPEAESGPLLGWVKGPHYTTTAQDIRRWGLQAIAHGAKMILYQGYREWNVLPLHWGALVDWHGEPTARLDASQQLGILVEEHQNLIEPAIPCQAKVGVLYDQTTTVFNASCEAEDYNTKALHTMHEILWRAGISMEYVNPEFCTAEMPYQVLILSFATMISAKTAAAIAAFVEAGGTLISMPRSGMVDEKARVWNTRPGGKLSDLLGVREQELFVVDDPPLTLKLNETHYRLPGFHHKQDLILQENVEVLGTFEDGRPALTRHPFGKGQGIHFATHFEMASANSSEHIAAWTDLLAQCGIEAEIQISHPQHELLDGHLMETEQGHLLVLCNESHHAVETIVALPNIQAEDCRALWEIGKVDLIGNDNQGCALRVAIPPQEGIIVYLKDGNTGKAA